jgi:hypothetical protein
MTARLPMMNMPSVQKSILPAWSRAVEVIEQPLWRLKRKVCIEITR